ncbi:osmotically inducible protein OsmC [Bacillus halotolerans]|uniref:OsmC family protein n=1 Tax=Bacillus halotolerans TaxID=260554 RepID=UPI000D01A838|nr:OsmC family protein [Bacillus halotolerans]PRP51406.1 osmotically inducible protein OsmC [Bacillus halotolerans]PRP59778.1 osmotically inducible protein OsmC [Bacillus halotolerans]PRP64444.1 osmotically inducible protein OsmC [Bacillus halotolerans]
MAKLNGVDMSIIEGLVEQYKKNPAEGTGSWSSSVKWDNGFHVEAKVGDHAPIHVDEPKWLAGSNKGANPVEYLLSALGSCLSVGFIATTSGMGIKINSLEVEVSGQLDLNVFLGLKEGNPGFDEINAHFNVDSDADEHQIEELVAQARKLSPVKNTIQRNVHVQASLSHNKKKE